MIWQPTQGLPAEIYQAQAQTQPNDLLTLDDMFMDGLSNSTLSYSWLRPDTSRDAMSNFGDLANSPSALKVSVMIRDLLLFSTKDDPSMDFVLRLFHALIFLKTYQTSDNV